MPLTVRLPPRLQQELTEYCVTHRVTKSDAVKQALQRLLSETTTQVTPFDLGKDGFGADDTPGREIARNTKRLIKERFRGKTRR